MKMIIWTTCLTMWGSWHTLTSFTTCWSQFVLPCILIRHIKDTGMLFFFGFDIFWFILCGYHFHCLLFLPCFPPGVIFLLSEQLLLPFLLPNSRFLFVLLSLLLRCKGTDDITNPLCSFTLTLAVETAYVKEVLILQIRYICLVSLSHHHRQRGNEREQIIGVLIFEEIQS